MIYPVYICTPLVKNNGNLVWNVEQWYLFLMYSFVILHVARWGILHLSISRFISCLFYTTDYTHAYCVLTYMDETYERQGLFRYGLFRNLSLLMCAFVMHIILTTSCWPTTTRNKCIATNLMAMRRHILIFAIQNNHFADLDNNQAHTNLYSA